MVSVSSATGFTLLFLHGQRHCKGRGSDVITVSGSLIRRGRKKIPKSDPEQKIRLILDLDGASRRASASLRAFLLSSQSKLRRFFSSGAEAFSDLQSLITSDQNGRIVISCRQSTLDFLANLFVWSFILGIVIRSLWASGLRSRFGRWDLIRRRDRSLGGREVVVGRRVKEKMNSKAVFSPLSKIRDAEVIVREKVSKERSSRKEALPSWWPDLRISEVLTIRREGTLGDANRFIRAIMDNRMSGMDITEDDIIQVRRICKDSGSKIFIETANARDSLYRAAIGHVLQACSNASQPSLVQIGGEQPQNFVAGLADNFGIDKFRAAKLVCAAVAAYTRSKFLQAWAFEIQGRRSEALMELLMMCRIFQIFPPEEDSPEMEMLAQGLGNHLKFRERKHLFDLLQQVCSLENESIAAKALGLQNPELRPGELWQENIRP